ncbi:MAG: SDR family NAD(P)-dependent oxidoreductase [Acidimicrobiales bacterium]
MGERLAGRVALISGGARGQGADEGALFASEGATVVLADVLDEVGEKTAGGIDRAEYAHLDVTSEQNWDQVVADVMARHGRLDILVNNAGILSAGKLTNLQKVDWDRTIAINQTGVMLGMRAGAKAMIEAGNGGSIVNISSVAGLEGLFGSMSYTASKWAVRGMTKVAAKELGKHGIRVNSIHPGFIQTDMVAHTPAMTDPTKRAKAERNIPIGRLGVPRDIANMVLFLASDESSYCTGQEYTVDGGVHG